VNYRQIIEVQSSYSYLFFPHPPFWNRERVVYIVKTPLPPFLIILWDIIWYWTLTISAHTHTHTNIYKDAFSTNHYSSDTLRDNNIYDVHCAHVVNDRYVQLFTRLISSWQSKVNKLYVYIYIYITLYLYTLQRCLPYFFFYNISIILIKADVIQCVSHPYSKLNCTHGQGVHLEVNFINYYIILTFTF